MFKKLKNKCPFCSGTNLDQFMLLRNFHDGKEPCWECKDCGKRFDIRDQEVPPLPRFYQTPAQAVDDRTKRIKLAAEDMYKALKQIAEMDSGEHEVELAHDQIITTDCVVCEEMIELARETLKRAGLLED